MEKVAKGKPSAPLSLCPLAPPAHLTSFLLTFHPAFINFCDISKRVGDRLMAGQQPLTLPIGVRVPVSQPLLGNFINPA